VWRLLAELGCDQGQGYFMSRPIPGDQLLAWRGKWQAPIDLSGRPAFVPAARVG
jgi:EAL domain-containing protein (putative c-di-GMP-specific phosphodiesterase class I)